MWEAQPMPALFPRYQLPSPSSVYARRANSRITTSILGEIRSLEVLQAVVSSALDLDLVLHQQK